MRKVMPDREIVFLRRLETDGPQIPQPTDDALVTRLWLRGMIDKHPPKRFRISESGRRALDDQTEPGEQT